MSQFTMDSLFLSLWILTGTLTTRLYDNIITQYPLLQQLLKYLECRDSFPSRIKTDFYLVSLALC